MKYALGSCTRFNVAIGRGRCTRWEWPELKRNAGRLRVALGVNHEWARVMRNPDFPREALFTLQQWQRDRLAQTYSDFESDQRYAPACRFFLEELYGGLDFSQRDQDVARVLPVMVRMMPDELLGLVAQAFELQALSLELDAGVTNVMLQQGWVALDRVRYGQIYRLFGHEADRHRQIEWAIGLGIALQDFVHHRWVRFMLRMVRGPARAAGFSELQSFIERGFMAFHNMGDGSEFINAIQSRETRMMQALLAGRDVEL